MASNTSILGNPSQDNERKGREEKIHEMFKRYIEGKISPVDPSLVHHTAYGSVHT